MKLKDQLVGPLSVSGSIVIHFPFMVVALFLALISPYVNEIPSLNWLTWLFFFVHLTIVLIFSI